MGEVVEHQPADRHGLEVEQAARLGQMSEPGVVRMEGQGNESLEAAGLVLQGAQAAEVIDAVARLFDVAVKHRRIGAQAELVGLTVNANPGLAVGLVLADLVAHFGMKDLSPAAGQAAQARFLELGEQFARRPAGEPREPVPFDGGVRLQMQARLGLVNDADDVQIPFVRQLVVQSADDVHLRSAAPLGLRGPFQDLLVGHHVTLLALQVGPEGAEGAAIDADVGRVQVRVDVVVGEVAVLALAHAVRQLAEREQVGVIVEEDAVVEREPFLGLDFFADGIKSGLDCLNHILSTREGLSDSPSRAGTQASVAG